MMIITMDELTRDAWQIRLDIETTRAEAAEAETQLLKESVWRVAANYARDTLDWRTLLEAAGVTQPWVFPGDGQEGGV